MDSCTGLSWVHQPEPQKGPSHNNSLELLLLLAIARAYWRTCVDGSHLSCEPDVLKHQSITPRAASEGKNLISFQAACSVCCFISDAPSAGKKKPLYFSNLLIKFCSLKLDLMNSYKASYSQIGMIWKTWTMWHTQTLQRTQIHVFTYENVK